ncbi:hypothetical protein VMT65_16445 [Nocardia sp. CDC153]|uniref:hypothetical protein n=1 Tax=Nocardia sp. CDC153 TaxID=3112167 RepID=UPI002DB6D8CF|nr:hypothetical protein [Nocardia sp. CDC153]MEC3954631.1 hypothetical protein [Nocardia sp. CDC153]
MDASLTAQRAQQRIYELMTDTVRGLPAGIALSKTPDSPVLGKDTNLYPLTIPCWEGNTQTEGPHYLSVGYWIIGVPPGATRDYFDRIKRVWQDRNWKPVNSTQWVLAVKTEDGYGLQLQDADKGDGSLSLTGMSPCIPQSALEPIDPDPAEIKAG